MIKYNRKADAVVAVGMAVLAFVSLQVWNPPFIHIYTWLEAAQGDAIAQFSFGRLYEQGGHTDAKRAWSTAVEWYRKSAEKGYGPAEFEIGRCYNFGYCGEKDATEIAKWDQRAAEHGYWMAQGYLSYDYYDGRGVKQDYTEAYFWLQIESRSKKKLGVEVVGLVSYPHPSHLTSEQEASVIKRVDEWEKAHPDAVTDPPQIFPWRWVQEIDAWITQLKYS